MEKFLMMGNKNTHINKADAGVSKPEPTPSKFTPEYCVYTDGACSNNGKTYAKAGIGIFFGENDERNLSKRIEGKQTNNTAELTAIIETYKIIENDILSGKKISIFTDSEYAMKCISTYGDKCYKKNWQEDIPNKELVRTVYDKYKNKPNVKIIHIRAHTGKTDIHSIGNHHADRLANESIGIKHDGAIQRPTKIYLDVPFNRKDEAKEFGARWDVGKKKWFTQDDNKYKLYLLENFSR
jgi:ribonuclease HI